MTDSLLSDLQAVCCICQVLHEGQPKGLSPHLTRTFIEEVTNGSYEQFSVFAKMQGN